MGGYCRIHTLLLLTRRHPTPAALPAPAPPCPSLPLYPSSPCRQRSVEAYSLKKAEMDAAEAGLASKAERFFVLVQTDNLWKEHLQAIKFLQQAVRWAAGRMGAAGAAVGWLRCDLPGVCLLACLLGGWFGSGGGLQCGG